MQYRNIKVKVPTPEISRMVQEKLFEQGVRWLVFGESVTFTDSKFLFVDSDGVLTVEDHNQDYFERHYCKQVHYLQILTGDDTGHLYRNRSEDTIYYHLNGESYWYVAGGRLESVEFETEFNLGLKLGRVKLIDVNEEEITMQSNEMPKLEAGKHVVKMQYDYDGVEDYYLVLENSRGLYGKIIDEETKWASSFDGSVLEIHKLPIDGKGTFDPSVYNKSTLIWKRDNEAGKRREEYEQLQRQIAELTSCVSGLQVSLDANCSSIADLQAQANKLGESL